MTKVNWVRILFGGILAGMVISAGDYFLRNFVLDSVWKGIVASFKPVATANDPVSATGMAVVLLICDFLMGGVGVWICAASRPRFTRAGRAIWAASLAVWLPGYLLSLLPSLISGLLPWDFVFTLTAAGFVEVTIGIALGAWIYRELPQVTAPPPQVAIASKGLPA
ncbi:MAG TPA: hypothetical protein VMH81_01895 [Bryobacteraceae bacterium]|nr:hypothetical protein [Bryobacteraceae bacterium]